MTAQKKSKGLFLSFEGGEGAGKTTLIERLEQKLLQEGFEVLKTREPGGTSLGEKVRELLLQQTQEAPMTGQAELCLFLASRAQHVEEIIGPALQAGKIILCDRFNDSSVAYQGAARGLGMEQVAAFCHFASQGMEPHATLYLDIDPEIGLARAKRTRAQDRIEREEVTFHRKIREAYQKIAKQHPKRFHLLDASQSADHVFQQSYQILHPLLFYSHV